MKGLFGNLFDFNHDGKVSGLERAAEFAVFKSFIDDEEQEDEIEEKTSELEEAGLDPIELEFMDEDERTEALEDAGIDPDEYEDFDWD